MLADAPELARVSLSTIVRSCYPSMMLCAIDRLPSSRPVLCNSTAIQTDQIGEIPSSTEFPLDLPELVRSNHFIAPTPVVANPLTNDNNQTNDDGDDDEKSCSDDDDDDDADYEHYQTGDPELDDLINNGVYDHDDFSCASESVADDLAAVLDDQFTIVEGEPDPDVGPTRPAPLTAASATSAFLSAQLSTRSGAFLDWSSSSLASRSLGPLMDASPCDLVNPLTRFRSLSTPLQMTSSLARITMRQGETEPNITRMTLTQVWSNHTEGQTRMSTFTNRLPYEPLNRISGSLIHVREGN